VTMDRDALLAQAVGLMRAGRLEDSEAAFGALLEQGQAEPEALRQMAGLLAQKRDYAGAAQVLKQALAYEPFHADAWRQLGAAYSFLGRHEAAGEAIRRARSLRPYPCPIVEWHVALQALREGEYREGFAAYEWGKLCGMRKVRCLGAEWEGSYLGHYATLFIWCEQGQGDTLQFLRFLPQAAAQSGAGKIVLEVQEPLVGLLCDFPGVEIVAQARDGAMPCCYDAHCALMSLPYILQKGRGKRQEGREMEQMLAMDAPYLFARSDRVAVWRERLQTPETDSLSSSLFPLPLKVGFCWQGDGRHANDGARSLHEGDFEMFDPILHKDGVTVCPLHLGAMPDGEHPLLDWVETAAVIANLDLVISVDTAVAHLAGAMGKPVWLLLPAASDWRWLRDRADSPWYPSMTIFRQEQQGEWGPVAAVVAWALLQEAREDKGGM